MANKPWLKRERHLELLADRLTARHLRIAIPDTQVRKRLVADWRGAVSDTNLVERDMHCIAVVGAGASQPLLARGDELAAELEAKFGRDEVELNRLSLVYNLDSEQFETRLVALSRSPDAAAMVRKTISEKYKVQHPTLLGNELLAHLLKHRFLDAIISFNFDELLDRSLEDELSKEEYVRIISERDCDGIQPDPSAPDYVPLYVKLHGTASEPDSLRFTADAYYSIPQRISGVVQELLHAEECVIVNVGSGLATFDLQHLFNIPQALKVFNLSYKPVNWLVSKKIDEVRNEGLDSKPKAQPQQTRKKRLEYPWLHDCNPDKHKCDELLQQLTDELARKAKTSAASTRPQSSRSAGLLQFRSVGRHEAVAQLLGPDTVHRNWAAIPGWSDEELTEYARRRTILELALTAAKARGLLSLVPLSEDRAARYYDDYRRLAGDKAESWPALCSAAGLIESREAPDILLSDEALRRDPDRLEPTRRRRRQTQQALVIERKLRKSRRRQEALREKPSKRKRLKKEIRNSVDLTKQLAKPIELEKRLRQEDIATFEKVLRKRRKSREKKDQQKKQLEDELTKIQDSLNTTRKKRARKKLKSKAKALQKGIHKLTPAPERTKLHKFDPETLAHHVLAHVRNPSSLTDARLLTQTFKKIQKHSEVELHMRDDRVCSKAFKDPATLPTSSSLQAYTRLMLSDLNPDDKIYISSEKGEWLLHEPIRTLLASQTELFVLLAFADEAENLLTAYPGRISLALIDPWRHNRHMTIVCKGDRPTVATYFARRLRTHVITAVYLQNIADVELLMQTYSERWDEAKKKKRWNS
jgi:hypothetical protein